jgi:hypothetical protein
MRDPITQADFKPEGYDILKPNRSGSEFKPTGKDTTNPFTAKVSDNYVFRRKRDGSLWMLAFGKLINF